MYPKNSRGRRRRDERGAVLLLVMLIMVLISVLALSWAQEWGTELQLAANFREAHQCRRLAEAGVYYALGKLLEGKILETKGPGMDPQELAAKSAVAWQGDQRVHELEFPGGLVAVQVADEGGKLNLNLATEENLGALFAALGYPQDRLRIMVDSLLDWRSRGEQPRPYGAKTAYYQRLEPPYVSRNGPLEVVEELAWVQGFEAAAMVPRLSDYLTVQSIGRAVNINTASLPVLLALGLPAELAQNIILVRQNQPLKNFQDIGQLSLATTPGQTQTLTFRSSPFFSIKSTGMVNKKGGRQTIKAVVRLDISLQNSWEIMSWVDDFPG